MPLTVLTGLTNILDIEFYKQRGHAVLACLFVLYLTIGYVLGLPVHLSIFADLTIVAGMLIILPQLKINGIESSNKLARNIFGYFFLAVMIIIALGDSHGFLALPEESKAEFFTLVSHICMVLFGASKVEVSRRAIESVKDAFNWKRGYGAMMTNFYDDYEVEDGTDEKITEKKIAQKELNSKVNELRTPSNRYNLLSAMQSYRGMCEVKGPKSNEKLLRLAKQAGFVSYTSDDIPWCAVMMNIACMVAGVPGTKSARAKDFRKWGTAITLDEARRNIGKVIAIFHRGVDKNDPSGHVTVVESISADGKSIVGIGGNQGDCVKSSLMPINNWRFIEFRMI